MHTCKRSLHDSRSTPPILHGKARVEQHRHRDGAGGDLVQSKRVGAVADQAKAQHIDHGDHAARNILVDALEPRDRTHTMALVTMQAVPWSSWLGRVRWTVGVLALGENTRPRRIVGTCQQLFLNGIFATGRTGPADTHTLNTVATDGTVIGGSSNTP